MAMSKLRNLDADGRYVRWNGLADGMIARVEVKAALFARPQDKLQLQE
jgi:hypothetical protein